MRLLVPRGQICVSRGRVLWCHCDPPKLSWKEGHQLDWWGVDFQHCHF